MGALQRFIQNFGGLLESNPPEEQILDRGSALLGDLVREDGWLPDVFAVANPERYQQYLLHLDPEERFSVVSFVWGAGQQTPVHDHTVWGLIGMLRGAEIEQHYTRLPDGSLNPEGETQRLEVGQVDRVSPRIGDLHRVSNAFSDRTSISIHVYQGNIGAVERSTYGRDGTPKHFISGYSKTSDESGRSL
jgi:3-mercaptopropionate dioxygenase